MAENYECPHCGIDLREGNIYSLTKHYYEYDKDKGFDNVDDDDFNDYGEFYCVECDNPISYLDDSEVTKTVGDLEKDIDRRSNKLLKALATIREMKEKYEND